MISSSQPCLPSKSWLPCFEEEKVGAVNVLLHSFFRSLTLVEKPIGGFEFVKRDRLMNVLPNGWYTYLNDSMRFGHILSDLRALPSQDSHFDRLMYGNTRITSD
ncbi:Uncharacterized protein TCM_015977 [Theobroma cacao]|uniref:Uncharacterized protein n=1 Tax=Theobroma cacao TaxID=3641 RepID=A0A061GBC1_THECC|nr:Uncharacterized protein TCM_015977 [Theobroma cacao]